MRVVIFTDSLGMPRDGVSIENTWTRLFINKYAASHEIFTFFKRGANTNDIVQEKSDFLHLFRPNLIIVQVGIVDCVRRALPLRLTYLTSRVPILSSIVRKFSSKYHYVLTKLHKSYAVELRTFEENMNNILTDCSERNIIPIVIRIAEPGAFMRNKTYNVEQDVQLYNQKLKLLVEKFNGVFVDPYRGQHSFEYVLDEDGHHLNSLGHELVFDKVCCAFDNENSKTRN